MVKLKNPKLSGKLRRHTNLRPVSRNETRWSSTFSMVERYCQIRETLAQAEFSSDKSLLEFLPTPKESTEISDLLKHFTKFNSVQKSLQKEDVGLADARILFDHITMEYPLMKKYLASDAGIVHSPTFEKAVIKIQNEKTTQLSDDETDAIVILKLEQSESAATVADGEDDFASTILKKRRSELKGDTSSGYLNIKFLLPTSNLVERFFSTAKMTFNDHRQSLLPVNLEEQLFLKINARLYDEELVSSLC